MTRTVESRSSWSPNLRTLGVLATLGLMVLAAMAPFAVPATPAVSGGPGDSGLVMAGNFTCPNAPMNWSAVTLTTNVTSGPIGLTVQFCSAAPHAVSATRWNFGDNFTSTAANTTYQFDEAGSFDVVLNVTYAQGGSSAASVTITVTGGPQPLGVDQSVTPLSGAAPLNVTATTVAYNAVGAVTYWWEISQNNVTWQLIGNDSSQDWTNFTLSVSGAWYVEGTARDSDGNSASALAEVEVTNGSGGGGGGGNGTGNGTGPFAVYPTASPASAPAPANVFFNATVSGGVAPYTFLWTFGDGGSGSGQWQEHVYTDNGTYLARVRVTDQDGFVNNSTSVLVTVTGNQSSGSGGTLSVNFTADPTQGPTPLNVTFRLSASGGDAPYSYVMYNSTGEVEMSGTGWGGSAVTEYNLYAVAGNYTAEAVVTDANGSQVIDTIPIVVTSSSPLIVSVLSSFLNGTAPFAVGFLASVSGGTAPYAIQWNWGDGSLSSSANGAIVAHAYTSAGAYSPTLRVSDADGHNVTVSIGTANVANGSTPAGRTNPLLPSNGSPSVLLEYLGIAVVGALLSGVALGVFLRRRGRQKDGAALVNELETTAGQPGTLTGRTEGER